MNRALAAAACLLAGSLFAQEYKLGTKVTGFNLEDLSGKAATLSALGGPITVVTFVATQCPVSNAYNDRMNAIYKDYSGRGVKFIFVNANRTEPAAEVAEHARRVGFVFPVYKDPNNHLADLFGATVTPESYVMDKDGVLRYHGSIDDSQNPARINTQGLRLALDAVMAGRPVSPEETRSFGCSIKRVR
jgi:thiol-disulfide isomerase/thioredoxin